MTKIHRVKPGDSISSLAAENGFSPDTIWHHADNQALREQREHMNVLCVGDDVAIPDKRTHIELGATAEKHQFKRLATPAVVSLVIEDAAQQPLTNVPWRVNIDGKQQEGVTGSDGLIEVTFSPTSKRGTLHLQQSPQDEEDVYQLDIGHLDPISEPHGVQQRVTNLGFACGDIDGDLGPISMEALDAFRVSKGLEPGGPIDNQTRYALKDAHRS
jgi:hypothetical protein